MTREERKTAKSFHLLAETHEIIMSFAKSKDRKFCEVMEEILDIGINRVIIKPSVATDK